MVALICILGATGVQAVSLDELIATGGTITNGDKIFGDFIFTSSDFAASNIEINPITDAFGVGIQIQAGFNAMEGETHDALLQYSVTAAGPYISDLHLAFNGAIRGLAVAEVVETVFDSQMNFLTNFFVSVDPGGSIYQSTVYFVPALQSLIMRKDIQLITRDTEDFDLATISFVDQTFSQIPEPNTAMLLIGGIAGLCLIRWRIRHAPQTRPGRKVPTPNELIWHF